jgi:ankyrin repeat protein
MNSNANQELWQAAQNGDLDALNQALSQGAEVNARSDSGDTALNMAAEGGHLALVEMLLVLGADTENQGGFDKTPLENATFAGQIEVVQLLLEKGARISQKLLAGLQMKVKILEENSEDGMVNPAAFEAWQRFLDHMVNEYQQQNPSEGQSTT